MPQIKLKIKKLESEGEIVEDCLSTRNSDIHREGRKNESKYTYNTNTNYIKPEYFTVQIKKQTPS